MAERDGQQGELVVVVYTGYFLRDCFLSAPFGLFPDDDRYHTYATEHMELGDADSVRFGDRSAYYADCVAGKLQRREYRQPHEQDGDFREMVPAYMRGAVLGIRRVSDDPLFH